MPHSRQSKLGFITLLALIGAEVLWGVNTPVIKYGLQTVPLPVFLSVTILGAALLIAPLAKQHWRKLSARDYWIIILASFIGITLGNVVSLMGLERIPSVNVATIKLFAPIVLLLLSVEFLKEQLNLRTFGGILVAFIGAAILIGQPWQPGHQNEAMGALLVILAILCDVVATLMMKTVLTRASSFQVTFIHLLSGILPIAIYSLAYLPTLSMASIGRRGLVAMVANILLITAANVLYMYGLKHRQAGETGIFRYVTPLATFIAAWFILGEVPDRRLLFGAPLIFLGVFFAETRSTRARLRQRGRAH